MTPAVAAAGNFVRRVTAGERGPLALYGAYTLVLFLACLVVTFPHELLVRRILARTAGGPVGVEVRGVHLTWPLAYRLDELRLVGADGNAPLFAAGPVTVTPSLFGLVRGHPYPLGVRGNLAGGTLAGTLDLRPRAFVLDLTLAGLDAGRLAVPPKALAGTLRGALDGALVLGGDTSHMTMTNGRLELRGAGLALEGGSVRGIGVPDLHFTELRVRGEIKAGRLELGELVANGQEVNLQGEGNLLLQQPLTSTLMNLRLTLRPAADLPDNLRLALNLLPGEVGAGGERTLRLVGSLGQPRVQ